MKWLDAMVQRRPLVVVEDHWYHTAELVAQIAGARPELVGQIAAISLDRPGPDTDAAIADCRRHHPALLVVVPDTADLKDPSAAARLIARYLRPGGLLVQDVQLSTLPFVPADRWWESIYCVAATVRGLFAEQAPEVRFLSNKRGYAATFGRDLAEAGFDPRDVMDKAELSTVVVPTLVRYLDTAFPMRLSTRISGQPSSWRVSLHDAERRALSSSLDLLLWIDPHGWELGGRLVKIAPPARGLNLRVASNEAESWLALLTERLDDGSGLSVVSVGERVGPPDVDRGEATNLAARHMHTLRSRLRDGGAIITEDHAYRLRDDLEIGICRRSHA